MQFVLKTKERKIKNHRWFQDRWWIGLLDGCLAQLISTSPGLFMIVLRQQQQAWKGRGLGRPEEGRLLGICWFFSIFFIMARAA